jgi:hypothetical protein
VRLRGRIDYRSRHGETHLPSFIEKVYNEQRLHSVFGIYLGKNRDENLANRRLPPAIPGKFFQSDGNRRELLQLVNNIPNIRFPKTALNFMSRPYDLTLIASTGNLTETPLSKMVTCVGRIQAMLLLHRRLSSLSRFGGFIGHYESTAKVAASCTASKHHIVLTPFPTGDISFARVKGVSNFPSSVNTRRAGCMKNLISGCSKNVQMRGAREIDERRRIY